MTCPCRTFFAVTCRFALFAIQSLLTVTAVAQVSIDAPRGSWKHSGGEAAQHMQEVNYPASRVNAGRQGSNRDGFKTGAAIRGQILNAPKRVPQLLVVNGIAMPLSVDAEGRFARPYSFPPGSNNVEVRSSDRKFVRRVNFYDANPNRQRIGLRIVLSWDTDMTDLDLHVISPDGQHVFYGRRVAANGGALDVDVTGGYGPEIFAIPSPPHGLWQVYVNYFGGGGSGDGEGFNSEITIAQIALITGEGTPDEKQQSFRVPMRRPGELTLIKSFVYP